MIWIWNSKWCLSCYDLCMLKPSQAKLVYLAAYDSKSGNFHQLTITWISKHWRELITDHTSLRHIRVPVHKGTFIKDVRFFCDFLEIPTYLCPIHYVLSIYVVCPIFLDIPTYPKIGHPLWMFPTGKVPSSFCIRERS